MSNTVDEASLKAKEWCKKNKGWERICDIPDYTIYNKTFEELSKSEKKEWNEYHPSDPIGAWEEFGIKESKIRSGLIGSDGIFYNDIFEAIKNKMDFMTVMKTGKGK